MTTRIDVLVHSEKSADVFIDGVKHTGAINVRGSYNPTVHKVTVDGVELADVDVVYWRNPVLWVSVRPDPDDMRRGRA